MSTPTKTLIKISKRNVVNNSKTIGELFMNTNEKWDWVVHEFHTCESAREETVQRLWENIFAEIFNYSRLRGEIDSHRSMKIGSTERVIPDIIIKEESNGRDLFIIELKQHLLPFEVGYKQQLFSYMRLFRINVGILICKEIHLYVLDSSNTEFSMDIPFLTDCENGNKFIELFSKGNFNYDTVKQFILNDMEKRRNFDSHVKEIRLDIQKRPLLEIIKNYYSKTYTDDEINRALSGLNLSITQNAYTESHIKPFSTANCDLENKFQDYLLKKYSPNTTSAYLSAIRQICKIEQVNLENLYNSIEEYAPKYRPDGEKNHLGQRGHATWKNALERLFDFYHCNR